VQARSQDALNEGKLIREVELKANELDEPDYHDLDEYRKMSVERSWRI